MRNGGQGNVEKSKIQSPNREVVRITDHGSRKSAMAKRTHRAVRPTPRTSWDACCAFWTTNRSVRVHGRYRRSGSGGFVRVRSERQENPWVTSPVRDVVLMGRRRSGGCWKAEGTAEDTSQVPGACFLRKSVAIAAARRSRSRSALYRSGVNKDCHLRPNTRCTSNDRQSPQTTFPPARSCLVALRPGSPMIAWRETTHVSTPALDCSWRRQHGRLGHS